LKRTLERLVEIQRSHMEYGQEPKFEEEINVVVSAWQDARHAYVLHVSNHGCRSSQNLI
jgi:hypothetical protein